MLNFREKKNHNKDTFNESTEIHRSINKYTIIEIKITQ